MIPVGEKSSRYREEEEREHWPEQGYEIGGVSNNLESLPRLL